MHVCHGTGGHFIISSGTVGFITICTHHYTTMSTCGRYGHWRRFDFSLDINWQRSSNKCLAGDWYEHSQIDRYLDAGCHETMVSSTSMRDITWWNSSRIILMKWVRLTLLSRSTWGLGSAKGGSLTLASWSFPLLQSKFTSYPPTTYGAYRSTCLRRRSGSQHLLQRSKHPRLGCHQDGDMAFYLACPSCLHLWRTNIASSPLFSVTLYSCHLSKTKSGIMRRSELYESAGEEFNA